MDLSFESTREYQFLQGIIECIDDFDEELFTQKIHEFDKLTKLDNWKISLLLKIKQSNWLDYLAEPFVFILELSQDRRI